MANQLFSATNAALFLGSLRHRCRVYVLQSYFLHCSSLYLLYDQLCRFVFTRYGFAKQIFCSSYVLRRIRSLCLAVNVASFCNQSASTGVARGGGGGVAVRRQNTGTRRSRAGEDRCCLTEIF